MSYLAGLVRAGIGFICEDYAELLAIDAISGLLLDA